MRSARDEDDSGVGALLLDTDLSGADLRGSDLATLIVTTFQNGGALSNNRRKRYADRVQPDVLDAIEEAVRQAMEGRLPGEDPV